MTKCRQEQKENGMSLIPAIVSLLAAGILALGLQGCSYNTYADTTNPRITRTTHQLAPFWVTGEHEAEASSRPVKGS